jgi:hypothetical protein
MTNFILFHVVNDKNPSEIGPELVETGAIATIKPTDAGQATRVTLKDGRAFKVVGKFEEFWDKLIGGPTAPLSTLSGMAKATSLAHKAMETVAQQEVIAAKDDELNEEETPVEKDKNKALTQKKK